MRRLLLCLLACSLLPSAALADPVEVELGDIGSRWLGPNYIDNLGWYIQSPGDLDGDGFDDFAVSAPQDEGPVTFPSVLRLYLGGAEGAPPSGIGDWNDVSISDGKVGTDAIFQFAFIPDATGDGEMDLLVAEPNASEAGKVLLIPGRGAGWPATLGAPDAVARWNGYLQDENPELAEETRPSLVAGGDFDGDGIADIVIASGLFNRVWVDYSETPFDGTIELASVSDHFSECDPDDEGSGFGAAIAVGNFNGDSRADLAVGAPGCETDEGRVFIWYGTPAGLNAEPDLQIGGGDRLGAALNVLDLNDDGVDDLLIQELLSALPDDTNRESRGNLWIHLGDANGLDAVPDGRLLGGFSDKRFGETVALLADTSNPADGLPELVVTSPEAAIAGVGQGAVYIFDGRDDWTGDLNANEAHYRVVGSHRDAWFGAAMATLDDFDGDGFPEIAIGEPNFTDGDSENDYQRGRLYLFTALPDRDEDGDLISTLNGDCDDSDPDISPAQFEDCDDDVDNDCDHEINEGCDPADDDDDDATAQPPGDDDDDGNGDCDCNSALSGRSPGAGLLLVLLAGGALLYRRRTL